jgi:hypothetical protein
MDQQSQPSKDKGLMEKLNDLCQQYLVTKAPYTIPASARETIVKIAPWVTVVGLVITIPVVLAVLGVGALFMPYAVMGGASAFGTYTIAMILLVVTIVMEAMAISGLFKRQMGAWKLMYYVVLIHAVADILRGDLFSALMSVVSLYILFQVKPLYKA